mmetsp:Transcript_124828/g.361094  ORF Transcript_124828/g.361094 Transcript_124828/m.361094 type:complete len:251 (-) Transcript_124828:138-890(-)
MALRPRVLHHRLLPLVPVVELLTDGAKHGLHAPIAPCEFLSPLRSQHLVVLRVVVIGDINLRQLPVHVVQPSDLIFERRAHHQLNAQLAPVRAAGGNQSAHRLLKLLRATVWLSIRQNKEQNITLGQGDFGHSLDCLRQRRGALGRLLERLDEPWVCRALHAHHRAPIEKVYIDAIVVEATGDVHDVRDSILQLFPSRRSNDVKSSHLGRHARVIHAARIIRDNDDLVVLQDGEVIGVDDGNFEALQNLP